MSKFRSKIMGENGENRLELHDQLLGEKMVIDQAGTPSNIIWENKCIGSK
jgi:hypothetical protein